MQIITTPECAAGPTRRVNHWALFIAFTGLLAGCDLPDRHDIAAFRKPAVWEVESEKSTSPPSTAQLSSLSMSAAKNSDSQTSEDSLPPPWEHWYLHIVESARTSPTVIGAVAMKSEPSPDAVAEDAPSIQVTLDKQMRIPLYPVLPAKLLERGGAATSRIDRAFYMTSHEQTFWHSADGKLQRVVSSTRRGPLQTNKTILVKNDSAAIETMGPTGITQKTLSLKGDLAFEGDLGGPLLVYQSLLGNPLGAKEVRAATVLLPAHDTIARLRLRGNSPVLAKRFNGEEITSEVLNEAVGLISTGTTHHGERCYWYDDEGVIQTTNIVGEPDFAFRCSEERFNSLARPILDESRCIGVNVSGEPIPDGQAFDKISHLALDVECLHPDPPQTLIDELKMQPSVRQYVQSLGDQRQRIIITREVVPDEKLSGRFETFQSPSTAVDLAATPLVNFRSGAMRGVLATVASLRKLKKRELATEINRTVHSLLTYGSLGRGFQPASEITTSTTADSTEHAIVLIAMLRANGIPARMALGLRLEGAGQEPADEEQTSQESSSESPVAESPVAESPVAGSPVDSGASVEPSSGSNSNRFGYHAWVLAEVDRQWISLDPTTGQTTTVDYVALGITDLADGAPDPLIDRILGQLRWFDFKVHKIISAR